MSRPPPAWLPVWLFVPNLIGYVRVACAAAAFASSSEPWTFAGWYALSYLLDAVDGPAARALGQASSFGALLDMVTDRACTAGLLAVLAAGDGPHAGIWLGLMCLDIVSHWMQMYG